MKKCKHCKREIEDDFGAWIHAQHGYVFCENEARNGAITNLGSKATPVTETEIVKEILAQYE